MTTSQKRNTWFVILAIIVVAATFVYLQYIKPKRDAKKEQARVADSNMVAAAQTTPVTALPVEQPDPFSTNAVESGDPF